MSVQYITVSVGEHSIIKFEVDSSETAQGSKDLSISESETTFVSEKYGLKEELQKVANKTTVTFDQIKSAIFDLAEGFKDVMQKTMPDEASLEFGLTIKKDVGLMVAKAGAEASIKVNLTWKRK